MNLVTRSDGGNDLGVLEGTTESVKVQKNELSSETTTLYLHQNNSSATTIRCLPLLLDLPPPPNVLWIVRPPSPHHGSTAL
jgi:hypothetical protein